MPRPDGLQGPELIAAALDLLRIAEQEHSEAHLRRAVSTAYYAMFHSLARIAADRLVRQSGRSSHACTWNHVYRSLQHGHAKRQCLNDATLAAYPAEIRRFAAWFAKLQEQRHRADYDPAATLDTAEARQVVRHAADRIRGLERATEADQRAFAAWVLLLARRR